MVKTNKQTNVSLWVQQSFQLDNLYLCPFVDSVHQDLTF